MTSTNPPGAKPGLSNTNDGVGKMRQGDPAATGSGLEGHTLGDISRVAPKRMKAAASTTSEYALGTVPD